MIESEEKEVKVGLTGMKAELIELVEGAKSGGVDFSTAPPALFKWSYPEHPDVEFQLLIKGFKPEVKKEESVIILT